LQNGENTELKSRSVSF